MLFTSALGQQLRMGVHLPLQILMTALAIGFNTSSCSRMLVQPNAARLFTEIGCGSVEATSAAMGAFAPARSAALVCNDRELAANLACNLSAAIMQVALGLFVPTYISATIESRDRNKFARRYRVQLQQPITAWALMQAAFEDCIPMLLLVAVYAVAFFSADHIPVVGM